MARNYSKKSRKADPSYVKRRSNAPDTQRTIPIAKVSETAPFGIVRVDRILSGLNHRLYRQHGSYRCKLKILSSQENTGSVEVYALSNTWYMKNAIQMAKRVHDQAMEEERAMGVQSRWYDFRISDNSGPVDEFVQALRSSPLAGTALTTHPGEYSFSQIEDAAGTARAFTLPAGGGTVGYNILQEYDRMGNTGVDPAGTIPVGGYDGADATLERENMQSLMEKGNNPPYNGETLNPDVFVQVGHLLRKSYHSSAAGSGISELSTGFFDAPLGMIWVKQMTSDSNVLLQLEVAAGNYKGVQMEAY